MKGNHQSRHRIAGVQQFVQANRRLIELFAAKSRERVKGVWSGK